MISIIKAAADNISILKDIGKVSFIESHGKSASDADINQYVNKTYIEDEFMKELSDDKNIYYIIYYNNMPAGFSKIIFNSAHADISLKNVTKLERLYLLKEFYDLKLGYELLKFNIELSKKNDQSGMWLHVWTENKRAVNFYIKSGFKIIGSHNYKISDTHYNPNHHMFLKY